MPKPAPTTFGPPPPRNAWGTARLGSIRLRPTWFGTVAEELHEDIDGRRYWVKIRYPVVVHKGQWGGG